MSQGKRFVTWAAVSSLPQAKKISLSEQKSVNSQHVALYSGIVVADLVVPGESRDIDLLEDACEKIEVYAQLRDMIRSKAFDVLVCFNRGRLGRTLALIESVAQLCRRSKILIYETESPPFNLDYAGDTYDSLLVGAIKSAGAQREISEIKRRHEMGMLGRFRKGEFLAKVPYGWREKYSADGQRTIEVDEEAAIAIRSLLLGLGLGRGLGYKEQAREMNARGSKSSTGVEWTRSSVRALWMHLYRYAGINEINAVSKTNRPYARTKGTWPPIITEEELHALLDERKVRRYSRRAARTYRFSLIVWCEKCNCRMNMQYCYTKNRNKKGEITSKHYHEIAACRSGKYHKGAFIVINKIMAATIDYIDTLKDRRTWGQYIGGDSRNDIAFAKGQIGEFITQIDQAKKQILVADDHLMDGKFDSERHTHQVSRLKTKIDEMRHAIVELEEKIVLYESLDKREDRLTELVENGMSYLTMADEREANARLRPLIKIWVADGKITQIDIL